MIFQCMDILQSKHSQTRDEANVHATLTRGVNESVNVSVNSSDTSKSALICC